jgi:hypothetical protein
MNMSKGISGRNLAENKTDNVDTDKSEHDVEDMRRQVGNCWRRDHNFPEVYRVSWVVLSFVGSFYTSEVGPNNKWTSSGG